MNDRDQRQRDLAAFAQGEVIEPGQPPKGAALVRPTTGIADRIVCAQEVAHKRNEAQIKAQLTQLAAWAGEDWFYRFPVKKAEGGQDWIQGPTIKLANNVARVFGNNETQVREIDVGDAWVFYARFTDIETGFSMERAFRQRKGQQSMRTKDAGRAQDIAYQIGQSKAIRNVIVNSLGIYVDFAFEEAKNSLVDKIGKNLEGSRQRAIQRVAEAQIELMRVERAIGRAAKNWLAPDIAQIVAMLQSVEDGMATADETFPKIESSVTAPSPSSDSGATTETGGAQGTGSPTDERAEGSPPTASYSSDADDESSAAVDDSEREAYERGMKAKTEGLRRSMLPSEYRNAAHDKEAQAWLRGHDGKAF